LERVKNAYPKNFILKIRFRETLFEKIKTKINASFRFILKKLGDYKFVIKNPMYKKIFSTN